MRKKKVLITGITGQDGSYLAELLLEKGYQVHGLVRRSSTFNTTRIDHIRGRTTLHYGDLADSGSLHRVLAAVRPDEIYNLAAQSHVRVSFDVPEYTADIAGMGVLRLLEATRAVCPKARFYQASSSEMFGNPGVVPQDENTPFAPQSPYAIAKVFAHQMAQRFRDAYNMFVACGILFNHESPRRGENFVTRKVTLGAARIRAGLQRKLTLGNLSAKRDWGYAPEYVEAMWRMLQAKKPDDFAIATGETHTVKEFIQEAFLAADLGDWKKYVEYDKRLERANEVNILKGRSSKAARLLGWKPKTKFKSLVKLMVQSDLEALSYRKA